MHDVIVGEDPDDLANGVALPNIGQELVAQARPFGGPFDDAAISTKVTGAGSMRSDEKISASCASRGSGNGTTPSFGSMVANG